MAGTRNGVAYDFERFEPRKATIVPLEKVQPQLRPKTPARAAADRRAHRRRLLARAGLLFAAVLLLVAFHIHADIQQSELTAKITATQTAIDRLKSENTRLEMEIASSIAYTNLEKAAADMGMQKQQSAQTVCVRLHDEDEAEILQDENAVSLWSRLMAWF